MKDDIETLAAWIHEAAREYAKTVDDGQGWVPYRRQRAHFKKRLRHVAGLLLTKPPPVLLKALKKKP